MALKYLRDNLKSLTWVLWLVVGVFVLLVFFEWGGYNDRRVNSDQVAATVGDAEVTYGEFQRQYRNLESNYRQAFGEQFNQDLIKQFNLPKQALDQLIQQKILLMEAENIGLRASDAEVRDAILSYPVFQQEGKFIGADEYKALLRQNRLDVDEFEESVRQDVLLDKLNRILSETAYISESAVEKAYRDQAERAKIRYVQLPTSEFGDVQAEDAEVEAYFAENAEDYTLPERRTAEYLLVDTVKLRRQIEVPEEELRAYYNDNEEDFTREEQVRARHILFKVTPTRPDSQAESDLQEVRRRVEAGEDFAQLAQELSEDEGSASRGGSLGYFGRNQMIKAFEDAAFNASVGDLVGPIKTDFGYHLIEVQDHRQGGLQPFDQVRAVVSSRVVGERVNEIAEAKAQELSRRIKQDGLGLQQVLERENAAEKAKGAEAEGADTGDQGTTGDAANSGDSPVADYLTLTTTEPFGQNDNIAGIGRAAEFNQKAFELPKGAISEPVKVPRGWALLEVKDVQSPRTPELEEVKDEVKQAADLEKRKTVAVERLQEMQTKVQAGEDFAALAGELGLEVKESEEFGRFGSIADLGSVREVIDGALARQVGEWGEPVETPQGGVLYEVIERKIFDPAEYEEQKEATRAQQESQRLNQLRASILELRKRDLTPVYDAQVFENFDIALPGAGG